MSNDPIRLRDDPGAPALLRDDLRRVAKVSSVNYDVTLGFERFRTTLKQNEEEALARMRSVRSDDAEPLKALCLAILDNAFLSVAETAGALTWVAYLTPGFGPAHVARAGWLWLVFLAVVVALVVLWFFRDLRPLLSELAQTPAVAARGATRRVLASVEGALASRLSSPSPTTDSEYVEGIRRALRHYDALAWLLPATGVLSYVAWALLNDAFTMDLLVKTTLAGVAVNVLHFLRHVARDLRFLFIGRPMLNGARVLGHADLSVTAGEARGIAHAILAIRTRLTDGPVGASRLHDWLRSVLFAVLLVVIGFAMHGSSNPVLRAWIIVLTGVALCFAKLSRVLHDLHRANMISRRLTVHDRGWANAAGFEPAPVEFAGDPGDEIGPDPMTGHTAAADLVRGAFSMLGSQIIAHGSRWTVSVQIDPSSAPAQRVPKGGARSGRAGDEQAPISAS